MEAIDADMDGVVTVEELRSWIVNQASKSDVEVHERSLLKEQAAEAKAKEAAAAAALAEAEAREETAARALGSLPPPPPLTTGGAGPTAADQPPFIEPAPPSGPPRA